MSEDITGIDYGHAETAPNSDRYLLPTLLSILQEVNHAPGPVFEIGCGSGWTAKQLIARGYSLTGIEPSSDGFTACQLNAPGAHIDMASAYDDLATRYGEFDTVFSLEVVEHLYAPRKFAQTSFDLLSDGGKLILSTPFHGYWKYLFLALFGKMDSHLNPLWDHGHIKFWSERTLSNLLLSTGFRSVEFRYAGRFYPISKSMFAIATK